MRFKWLGAIIAVAAALGITACTTPAERDVDAFHFESFHGDYSLSIDDEGRSALRTVETIVAVFPDYDQNRGIVRELVRVFDGHPTSLSVISVTDETGASVPFEEESDGDFLYLALGDDSFVHGEQTYVITYEQRDVTRHFADTGVDEFYWDANGTGWRQPFRMVTAAVHLDVELLSRLSGNVAAYQGYEGSNTPAELARTDDGFMFRATQLAPRQNLTFAIGFEPGTFGEFDSGFFASPWPTVTAVFGGLSLAALILAIIARSTTLRSARGRPVIVAEYLPPKREGILLSADILGRAGKATTAGLIELAVSGRMRIIEEGRRQYRLELASTDGLDDEQLSFVRAVFGSDSPGAVKRLGRTDSAAARRVGVVLKIVHQRAKTDGYVRATASLPRFGILLLALVSAGGGLFAAITSLEGSVGGWIPPAIMIVSVLVAIVTMILLAHRPLSERGAELRDHLKGLKEYISLAEADRLNYLQSPQGALREPVRTGDRGELIRLNERLLPYAVLFGVEKKWASELGRYYEEEGTSPSWYSGSTGFNAAVFAASVGSVSSSVSSSFSSSSGGSGGGGASGGGGGGGGGGGR